HRTRSPQDSPFQRHGTPNRPLDSTATESSISGILSVALREPGWCCQVWPGGHRYAESGRHKIRAHKPCKPVAKWNRGTLDRKLSQIASRTINTVISRSSAI